MKDENLLLALCAVQTHPTVPTGVNGGQDSEEEEKLPNQDTTEPRDDDLG